MKKSQLIAKFSLDSYIPSTLYIISGKNKYKVSTISLLLFQFIIEFVNILDQNSKIN